MPPDVANRLDAVLADLAGPPKEQVGSGTTSGSGSSAGSDELASRRNCRWPNLLVAAAAVGVIAVAGGAVATDGFGTLGGGDDVGTAKSASGPQDTAAPSTSGTRGLTGESAKPGVPLLHSTTLASDVQRLLRSPHSFTGGLDKAPQSAGKAPGKAALQCARPFTGRGSA